MDALQVQNWATDRIVEEKLQVGCEQEWEYIHFYKAFRDPMINMINNRTFFSYENYVKLFGELQERYPNVAENVYIAETTTAVARDMPFYASLLEDMLRDSFQRDILISSET